MKKNIYGSIGYTLLENSELFKQKIIVLADMHSKLSYCNNYITMGNWFKTKFNTSKILLEEVPRESGIKLEAIFDDSDHVKELKELYLTNPNIITGIDIRPLIIPYSLELNTDKIIMYEYLKEIDNFFRIKNKYLLNNLSIYNIEKLKKTKLGYHFLKIKINFYYLIKDIKHMLKKPINVDIHLIEKINNILHEIMEWYICANIQINYEKSIIIHVGLAHSEKIVEWLTTYYNYQSIKKYGINNMTEIVDDKDGCIILSDEEDVQFGGFAYNKSCIHDRNYDLS
jgi:hypothetical protein